MCNVCLGFTHCFAICLLKMNICGTNESEFQNIFTRDIYLEKNLLGLLLASHESSYCIRCHYFLGRHFLARYLKTRCLIDCYRSKSEIMQEFEQLKSNLPFE